MKWYVDGMLSYNLAGEQCPGLYRFKAQSTKQFLFCSRYRYYCNSGRMGSITPSVCAIHKQVIALIGDVS